MQKMLSEETEAMATKNMTIRLDEKLKEEAEALFDELGLTVSGAITVFLKQAVREQRIPFEIRKESPAASEKRDFTAAQLTRLQSYLKKLEASGEKTEEK